MKICFAFMPLDYSEFHWIEKMTCTCIQADDIESSLRHAVPTKQWKCKYIISYFELYKKGNIGVEGYNKETYCTSVEN
jgi:hypothetical protein